MWVWSPPERCVWPAAVIAASTSASAMAPAPLGQLAGDTARAAEAVAAAAAAVSQAAAASRRGRKRQSAATLATDLAALASLTAGYVVLAFLLLKVTARRLGVE